MKLLLLAVFCLVISAEVGDAIGAEDSDTASESNPNIQKGIYNSHQQKSSLLELEGLPSRRNDTTVTTGTPEDNAIMDPKKVRFTLGEETQRMGQVLKEFSNRLNKVLSEQACMNDKETIEEIKGMVNRAKEMLEHTIPAGEGMKTAKDTMMAIILEKMSKNVFEDVEKFSTFVSVISDDIHQLGASLIQEGIEMCDGMIIEDGLTEFDKKYLWDCVDTFKFERIKNETSSE
ncbi:uncharacterized protein ISCGN_017695 [Ixodes scapularis]